MSGNSFPTRTWTMTVGPRFKHREYHSAASAAGILKSFPVKPVWSSPSSKQETSGSEELSNVPEDHTACQWLNQAWHMGKLPSKPLALLFFFKFWSMLFNLLLKVTLSIFCFYFLLKYSWIQSPKLLSYLLYHFISGFKVYLMSTYCVPGNGSRLWRQSKEQFPGDIRTERWKRVQPETI